MNPGGPCLHGRAAVRLLRPGTGQPLCLSCFFELLGSEHSVTEEKVAAVHELTAIVFSPEGRNQRLSGLLVWRTPFLQFAVDALCTQVLQSEWHIREGRSKFKNDLAERGCDIGPDTGGAARLLLDFTAKCIAEELNDGAAGATGVAGACPDLLEALVALTAQRCDENVPVALLGSVFERLEPALASELLNRFELSRPLLAASTKMLLCSEGGGEETTLVEPVAGLVLRLAEQGSASLGPHLAASSERISEIFAAAPPGSATAMRLLALYSMCALHPILLQCLLKGEPALHLQRLAHALQAHLAAPAATLQGAAASLVDELTSAVPMELAGTWLRTGFLAEWLVEVCSTGGHAAARTAAVRAVGCFAQDQQLLQRLQGFAADAILTACTEAASSPGVGSMEVRRDLLSAGIVSLRGLLGSACPTPLAVIQLAGLLHAATMAHPLGDAIGSGIGTMECLAPIEISLAARRLHVTEAEIPPQLIDDFLILARRPDATPDGPLFEALCTILLALAQSCSPAFLTPAEVWSAEHAEGAGGLAQAAPRISRLLECAHVLGMRAVPGAPGSLSLIAPVLEVVLWPPLEQGSLWLRGGCGSFLPSWWSIADALGKLLQPLLLAAGVQIQSSQGSVKQVPMQRVDIDHLVAVLLAPSLRSNAPEPCCLLSAEDLLRACVGLFRQPLQDSPQTWLIISAVLHTMGWHGAEADLLECAVFSALLDCSESFGATCLRQLPLRALVFFSAAAARCKAAHSSEVHTASAASADLQKLRRVFLSLMGGALECESSAEEWLLLRTDGIVGGKQALEMGMKWLLEEAVVDSSGVDGIWWAMVHREKSMQHQDSSQTTMSMSVARCTGHFLKVEITWSWLRSVVPSVQWLATCAADALSHVVQEELPMLLGLIICIVFHDRESVRAFSRRGGIVSVARRWQGGAAPGVCAEFLMHLLCLAPADVFDSNSSAALLSLLESDMSQATRGAGLALQLAMLAAWRTDISGLASLPASSWFQLHVANCLTGEISGGEDLAWATVAVLLFSAAARCQDEPLRQLVQAIALYRRSTWSTALEHSNADVKAFASLALSASAFASARFAGDDRDMARQLLPDGSELQALVAISADNAASKACLLLRDASCLALVTLLSCPTYPASQRAQLLHAEPIHQKVLSELLRCHVPQAAGASEEAASAAWATAPALLYTLLLVRSKPCWLDESVFVQHALPLARSVQIAAPIGPQRLLALRVIEALSSNYSPAAAQAAATVSESRWPMAQTAVLHQLLDDDMTWAEAAQEAQDITLPKAAAPEDGRCLAHLHRAVSNAICSELGGCKPQAGAIVRN